MKHSPSSSLNQSLQLLLRLEDRSVQVGQAQAFFNPFLKDALPRYQQMAADLWKWVFFWMEMVAFHVYSRNNGHN